MGVRSHVAKWGSSLAVRISNPIAEQWYVREGSVIEIASHGDQAALSRRPHRMAEMMARVHPHNLHSEFDTGLPYGQLSMVERPYVPSAATSCGSSSFPGSDTSRQVNGLPNF